MALTSTQKHKKGIKPLCVRAQMLICINKTYIFYIFLARFLGLFAQTYYLCIVKRLIYCLG